MELKEIKTKNLQEVYSYFILYKNLIFITSRKQMNFLIKGVLKKIVNQYLNV